MRRVLLIVAPERFRDEEAVVPKRALEAAGCEVTVASTKLGMATGMLGARLRVDATIRPLRPEEFDAVALVGGAGAPAHLWDDTAVLGVIRKLHAAGKPVAAICLSGAALARAGVLAGKRATVFPTARAVIELKRAGAIYVEEPVVQDGTILTASGPEAAAAFGRALVTLVGDGP